MSAPVAGDRARIATVATTRALGINLLLTTGKLVTAVIAGSAALLADALHSLSDIVTDVVVLVGFRLARKPADDGHHWGHGKLETLASVLVGLLLAGAAAKIFLTGIGAVRTALEGEVLPAPHPLALVVALASIAAKEGLFRYTRGVARRIDSPALRANAWHQRSDALSSVGVALGIAAASLGGAPWRVLDPLAAVVVAVVVGKVAWSILRAGVAELLEARVDAGTLATIVGTAAAVPGVWAPHAVRTRRVGATVAVELHVAVPDEWDLAAAHDRAAAVVASLRGALGPASLVTVHVDPLPPRRRAAPAA